jgi:hypothetical protein
MPLGYWGQSTQTAAGLFGSEALRDYTHASKTFRSNSYANAPKLKFLFHVYFKINSDAWNQATDQNVGILVKDIKLPTYNFKTEVKNQYNRKRIIQTKINYEPIVVNFHDDNNNTVNKMWYAYYTYYYKDANKPNVRFSGNRGSARRNNGVNNGTQATMADFNLRDIYTDDLKGEVDWGYIGESSQGGTNPKVPFFSNITVFGFNQRNFTAYTLINPLITNFSHDTYNYSEGGGTMQNTMTIDYETVTYDEGALDGKNPSDSVTGFGLDENYDLRSSPLNGVDSRSVVQGQGGLVNASGGYVRSMQATNNYPAALATVGYNSTKYPGLVTNQQAQLAAGLLGSNRDVTTQIRNTPFTSPIKSATPSNTGVNNSLTIGQSSPVTSGSTFAGVQLNRPPPGTA